MIVGAQGYTIRDFVKTPKEIKESLKKLKAIGFNCFQMSAFGAIEPTEMRAMLLEIGLEISVTHTAPDRILNDTQGVINEHKILGCNDIGIGCMPEKYRGSIEATKAFISDFDVAAIAINKAGMKLHYHNHAFEYERYNGQRVIDVMISEMNPELWGFILDLYWVQFGGTCPAAQLEALKGRVDFCHFKDMEIVNNKQEMTTVMDGNLNFSEIFIACEKAGVRYAMIEQDNTYGKCPFGELERSYNNLKKAGLKF